MSDISSPITEELLLEQSDYIRALARKLVGEEGLAEDLGQDTWVAALEHPPGEGHLSQGHASIEGRPALVRISG